MRVASTTLTYMTIDWVVLGAYCHVVCITAKVNWTGRIGCGEGKTCKGRHTHIVPGTSM